MSVTSWITQVAAMAAAAVALILITLRIRGRARLVGQLGASAVLAALLATTFGAFVASAVMERSGYEAAYVAQAVAFVIRAILLGSGLILLARCVVLSYWRAPAAAGSAADSYGSEMGWLETEHRRVDRRERPGFDGKWRAARFDSVRVGGVRLDSRSSVS